MKPAEILMWAELGAKLVVLLGVPVANIIKLFKDSGGTDADAVLLAGKWAALESSVEARIAYLKTQIVTTQPV